MPESSTMLEQYRRIKSQHRGEILFFRLGDFYEMFNEDAQEASSILDLTLTKRQGQPMCGIPYHAAKIYIARLLKAGKKVAICEQKTIQGRRGLMDRDVVEVITPGTVVEDDFLEQSANNYLADICLLHGRLCFAYLDVSTGEFRAHSLPFDDRSKEVLRAELYRLSPRELLVQQSLLDQANFLQVIRESAAMIEPQPDWTYDVFHSADMLKRRFGVASLKGFGFEDNDPALAAAGNLLEYVQEMVHQSCPHIRAILRFEQKDYVLLDEATKRNLELVKNLSDSSRRDTLIEILDKTKTAGGARMLRQWLFQPLRNKARIEARHEAVSFLYHNQILLGDARKILASVLDVERLISRLAMDKAHAKDLRALRDSVEAGLALFQLIEAEHPPMALIPRVSPEDKAECNQVIATIDSAIQDDPSVLLTEGGIIRDGYNNELDELRNLHKNAQAVLESYLEEEKQHTGIQNLRIRYNRVIGYYLEVTKGNLSNVPSHFIRRQSLVGGERYTTDRLAELESKINGAQERIIELEKRLFLEVRENIKGNVAALLECAHAISEIDCLASLAQAATENGYTRPVMCEEPVIDIVNGRHPVVEMCLPYGDFVPNSISLSRDNQWFALITGPNMAGKSTILRQTALIVLLAHMGSFVPAEAARIGLVDKIFCRVGAQDNLARGESTFLVEMHEAAFILNTATANSLVIMDEVGRGTGTLDGVSIAWAVSEYLVERVGCRTLFATHYHELTTMGLSGLRNMRMAVIEHDGTVSFPKRLEDGASSGSYGIHVARLAGLPDGVISRASEIEQHFHQLERGLGEEQGQVEENDAVPGRIPAYSFSPKPSKEADIPDAESKKEKRAQMRRTGELFSPEDLVLSELRSINPNEITPLGALQILSELVEKLKQ
ncbi:MAG: DNA mismatch repair protein MutS [Rectinema subterraneum]|uniref:DNA mismatch repair protein MutS n=1 Tax=Rectinema subterraneum TaxID=2653714 RepID=UPI003C7BE182